VECVGRIHWWDFGVQVPSMGVQQSRPDATAAGEGERAISQGGAAPQDDAGASHSSEGRAEGLAGQGTLPPAGDGAVAMEAALPSASDILASVVATLAQCPGHGMSLADVRKRLPPALARLAEDTDRIRKWLENFKGLLEITGPPGSEMLTLTVGKANVPSGGAANGSASAPALPASVGPDSNGSAAAADGAVVAIAAATGGAGAYKSAATVLGESGAAMAHLGATGFADEDCSSPCTVQLRGLPFRATIPDIKAFLGEHANNLISAEPAIRMLLNRDGRPSGFARLQFISPKAAQDCREALHMQKMGDRYVEVLACSDKAGKMRHRRVAEVEAAAGNADTSSDHVECEQVLAECRSHMQIPGRNQILLSMLGIALSERARNYLRRANLGLKHFLARFPNEFKVEGPKGCERVIWVAGLPADFGAALSGDVSQWAAMTQTPKPELMMSPSPYKQPNSGGIGAATPSDWGTPGLAPEVMASQEQLAAEMMAAAMGSMPGGLYGWPQSGPAWTGWGQTPWDAQGGGDGAASRAARGDKGAGQAAATSGKRGAGTRSEVPAARSHAHLHPQSHPFANRPSGGASEAAVATQASGGGLAADSEGAPVPALRLRGLPFSVTVQDVLAFFSQHDVADCISDRAGAAQLLQKANGRPSGQAVVEMKSRYQAQLAQRALYNQWIGGRYIEVFVYGEEDDAQGTDSAQPGGSDNGGGSGVGAALNAPPPSTLGIGNGAQDWSGGFGGAAPWGMPPWGGGISAPPPPVPLTGEEKGEDWAKLFGFLWQKPAGQAGADEDCTAAAAVGPGTFGASSQSAGKPNVPVDTPGRAMLQV